MQKLSNSATEEKTDSELVKTSWGIPWSSTVTNLWGKTCRTHRTCVISGLIFLCVCRISALRMPASPPTTRLDATPPFSLWTKSSHHRWEPSWTSWRPTTASGETILFQKANNEQLDQVLLSLGQKSLEDTDKSAAFNGGNKPDERTFI